MMYASYEFYVGDYGGSAIADEAEYCRLERRAEAYIDALTMYQIGQSEKVTDKVRFAVCELCDIYSRSDARRGITSENTDGYSVSYGGDTDSEAKTEIAQRVLPYLALSGLLYRGIG